jgi:hypothetical protein
MYELKKNGKRIYELICWNRALVLWKKNLPGRCLTKNEKHCFRGNIATAKREPPKSSENVTKNTCNEEIPSYTYLVCSLTTRLFIMTAFMLVWKPQVTSHKPQRVHKLESTRTVTFHTLRHQDICGMLSLEMRNFQTAQNSLHSHDATSEG